MLPKYLQYWPRHLPARTEAWSGVNRYYQERAATEIEYAGYQNATMFAAIAPSLLLERIYRRSRGVDQCRSKPFVIFGQGVILARPKKNSNIY